MKNQPNKTTVKDGHAQATKWLIDNGTHPMAAPILADRLVEYSDQQNADLKERVKELEGEVNRTIDNLHMEIHVMITDARIAVTKLGIDHDKSEAVDRLLYDLDVLQGKMMDAFKTKETK